MPADVDQDKIKAALNDGILKIRLPKKETETPRHIEII
ncbi:MAG: Hsp20/alpha crystallin family protein [Nitrospirae bacterium]|nr:Hsp20/alpha crystallin family protein [Nitrospirota bacterium]